MKTYLLKILIRFFGSDLLKLDEKIDKEALDNWLFISYKDKGYIQYYTVRKKAIASLMSLGIEPKEYWKAVGRLDELKTMNLNIKREVEARLKAEKKKEALKA